MPTRQMNIDERFKYLSIQRPRYLASGRTEKGRLLDEMQQVTGLCRKVLIRRMAHEVPAKHQPRSRERGCRYGPDLLDALRIIIETHDYIAASRLWPELLPMARHLEAHGELHLTLEGVTQLGQVSLSTLKRLISRLRQDECHILRRQPAHPSSWRYDVPMRRIPWNTQEPGHFEVDLVHHCGLFSTGDYVHTIHMVDVATGWVELSAALGRSFRAVSHGFRLIQERLPFSVLELHPDNGAEFFNDHMARFWPSLFPDADLSRSRPYRKNDNRFVEQKNGQLVRGYLGYDRLDSRDQTLALQALYDKLWLYNNFFQPVTRLRDKRFITREDGSQSIVRDYDRARTPFARLVATGALPPERLRELEELRQRTNPRRLCHEIHADIAALFKLPSAADGACHDVLLTITRKEDGIPVTLSSEPH
jgi:hypothetical protein